MDWLQSNWIWFAVVAGFIAMHFYGHGGHRHWGSSRERDTDDANGARNVNDRAQDHADHGTAPAASPAKRHQHGC